LRALLEASRSASLQAVRVVAGSAKGVRLTSVPPGVRPVSDRAREGVFASLGGRVVEARVLDLFAGTGAMGIEALSRGAASAVFVDRASAPIRSIRENLERTHLAGLATVVRGAADRALREDDRAAGPFDLVLCDPPYDRSGEELAPVFTALDTGCLAGQDWTVACTRPIRNPTLVVPVHWAVARQLRYGDSLVTLYREEGWA